MESTEYKKDSVISPESDPSNNNVNIASNEAICESLTYDEQNTENTFNSSQSETINTAEKNKEAAVGFKKPLLIVGPKRGKIGKIRAINDIIPSSESPALSEKVIGIDTKSIAKDCTVKLTSESTLEENVAPDARTIPVPYLEPQWSGKPEEEYKLEVLKSGVILETIDLTERSFHVVGRLPSCNLSLAHPTISRYHAVIQYRITEDENNSKGFYLYDLESTHGTFWNGHRIKPRVYVRLHGGHMINFGCSQRKYIVQAPPEDQEEESELTFNQLKKKRLEELHEREIRQQEEKEAEEKAKQMEENVGIDWGMGEDADEETDLAENPYASMADEELYLDDPKKTLRGWFEREGYDLQYQVEEKGIGQFLCWVTLPKESLGGRSIKAEALVKGKKKEAVIQCALEACRILDKHGLLRQANHEARKKKTRNWEEEDYYDSDEDNFLDRTGTVERKREQRMKLAGKLEEKVETYTSLSEKHDQIVNKIIHLNNRLKEAQENHAKERESNEDSLDVFMSSLNTSTLSKSDFTKMKVELQNLRKEEIRLVKLINLTKPANLPPLISHVLMEDKKENQCQESKLSRKNISQGDRRKKSLATKKQTISDNMEHTTTSSSDNAMDNEEEEEEEREDDDDEEARKRKDDSHVIDGRKSVKTEETRKINNACDASIHRSEREKPALVSDKVELQDSMKTDNLISVDEDTDIDKDNVNLIEDKKRKRDRKTEKLLKSMKKHYDLDVHSEDYSTWLPPQDQSGDGRTSLNDKYGY